MGLKQLLVIFSNPALSQRLPDIPNVIFMAARKFGTAGGEHLTWAMNTYLARIGRRSDTAILESWPFRPEMFIRFARWQRVVRRRQRRSARSASMRSRRSVASACSNMDRRDGERRSSILRLNYAVELRYGVLVDIGRAVFERRPD